MQVEAKSFGKLRGAEASNMEAEPFDGLDALLRELLLHGRFTHVLEGIVPGSTSAHFTHQSYLHLASKRQAQRACCKFA